MNVTVFQFTKKVRYYMKISVITGNLNGFETGYLQNTGIEHHSCSVPLIQMLEAMHREYLLAVSRIDVCSTKHLIYLGMRLS